MKVYLDNNVVTAIALEDTPEELDAINRLLKVRDDQKVELVTSEITLQEIQQFQGHTRPELEHAYHGLQKVPIVRWDELVGMNVHTDRYTSINSP